MNENLIFLYGTLKRNQRNSHILKNADYIASSTTKTKTWSMYELISTGDPTKTCPGIYENGASYVQGEVYSVSNEMLEILDKFEEDGVRYKRERCVLSNGLKAWFYSHLDVSEAKTTPRNIWYNEGIETYTWRDDLIDIS